jgi:hypothetical protein
MGRTCFTAYPNIIQQTDGRQKGGEKGDVRYGPGRRGGLKPRGLDVFQTLNPGAGIVVQMIAVGSPGDAGKDAMDVMYNFPSSFLWPSMF